MAKCARAGCGRPANGSSELTFKHAGLYSARGIRHVAGASLEFCKACGDDILKHLKRVIPASSLNARKEGRTIPQ